MSWTDKLTDDDEWVVRTALSAIASDLEKVAESYRLIGGPQTPAESGIAQSAQRYREVLARIEMAGGD